jgi:hypothetical protein
MVRNNLTSYERFVADMRSCSFFLVARWTVLSNDHDRLVADLPRFTDVAPEHDDILCPSGGVADWSFTNRLDCSCRGMGKDDAVTIPIAPPVSRSGQPSGLALWRNNCSSALAALEAKAS